MNVLLKATLSDDSEIKAGYAIEDEKEWWSNIYEILEDDSEFIPFGKNSIIKKWHIVTLSYEVMKD